MTAPRKDAVNSWSIPEAERLIRSLPGVVEARIVAAPGGDVEEVHVSTTLEVRPKQTVRNVESALQAHYALRLDHRVISVSQLDIAKLEAAPIVKQLPTVQVMPQLEPGTDRAREPRLLFYSHHVESERSNQVRHKVELEWNEERYIGEASAADLPRPKLEAVATATLMAVEKAIGENLAEGRRTITLALDGVKVVEAFDRRFVLVAVHAISGRNMTRLSGTTVSDESTDRAAILATLQATDRWVRGHME